MGQRLVRVESNNVIVQFRVCQVDVIEGIEDEQWVE
jgi:hypothetical protein